MKANAVKRRMIITFILLIVSAVSIAQNELKPSENSYNYQNAVGLRIGETSGLTYKHFFNNSNAFEGIVGIWPYDFGLTGLYEKYINTNLSGLNFYFGGGGHVNTSETPYRTYYAYNGDAYVYERRIGRVAMGIDGIVGTEYKFHAIPLAISFDIKPFADIDRWGYVNFAIDPSIGVKFTFNKK